MRKKPYVHPKTVLSQSKFNELTVHVFLPTIFPSRKYQGRNSLSVDKLKSWLRVNAKGQTTVFASSVPSPYPDYDFCVWFESDEDRKSFKKWVGPLAYKPGPRADEMIAAWKERWAANMIRKTQIEHDKYQEREAKRQLRTTYAP